MVCMAKLGLEVDMEKYYLYSNKNRPCTFTEKNTSMHKIYIIWMSMQLDSGIDTPAKFEGFNLNTG